MKKPIQTQSKHFYSHMVKYSEVFIELENIHLSNEEREHLVSIIEENIHHSIIDTILSQLSKEDKKVFLHHLSLNNHESIWNHLKENIEHVEEKITKAAEDLIQEFKKDIEEVKKDS